MSPVVNAWEAKAIVEPEAAPVDKVFYGGDQEYVAMVKKTDRLINFDLAEPGKQ